MLDTVRDHPSLSVAYNAKKQQHTYSFSPPKGLSLASILPVVGKVLGQPPDAVHDWFERQFGMAAGHLQVQRVRSLPCCVPTLPPTPTPSHPPPHTHPHPHTPPPTPTHPTLLSRTSRVSSVCLSVVARSNLSPALFHSLCIFPSLPISLSLSLILSHTGTTHDTLDPSFRPWKSSDVMLGRALLDSLFPPKASSIVLHLLFSCPSGGGHVMCSNQCGICGACPWHGVVITDDDGTIDTSCVCHVPERRRVWQYSVIFTCRPVSIVETIDGQKVETVKSHRTDVSFPVGSSNAVVAEAGQSDSDSD